jgi:hypothetical protein
MSENMTATARFASAFDGRRLLLVAGLGFRLGPDLVEDRRVLERGDVTQLAPFGHVT